MLLTRLSLRMLKLVALVFCLASLTQAAPEPRIACQECMDEMHTLGYIVKSSAAEMEVRNIKYHETDYCLPSDLNI